MWRTLKIGGICTKQRSLYSVGQQTVALWTGKSAYVVTDSFSACSSLKKCESIYETFTQQNPMSFARFKIFEGLDFELLCVAGLDGYR